MSHLLPLEGLIKNLREEIPESRKREYLSRERAYEALKSWTGQDFGYNADEWEKWILESAHRRLLAGE
ncbi:MAG TPA: hypothetical protein VFI31_17805 [Pirellulales bacterium]|nr:hypothetical protein [Pirellulales bacterium]